MTGHNGKLDADVIAVGGGPGGSTVATLLRKYAPELSVLVLEREKFPRDHIGESQLPGVCAVLHEMGVWDEVERAGFPIKIGATLTWGRDGETWDFDFYPVEMFKDEPRPGKYEGQRARTAFQVDRAIYDNILLRHARRMGAKVREETAVRRVLREGDRITGLELESGEVVRAKWYVDASGRSGIIRREMGVGAWVPEELKNIAIWDYWQNADWAVKIGVGATRIQVRSLPWGWMWFIPLGPTRTSLGLVCPAAYYRDSGKKASELYEEAIRLQPDIARLLVNATSEGKLTTTNDWSHVSERLAGENWFLVGESAGFADPILSAGLNLTHSSARDCAFTIIEMERGVLNPPWLRARYDERHRKAVMQHVRFAQFWYASNGCFSELQDHCRTIAKEAGLNLRPDEAWRWLAWGGFAFEQPGHPTLGAFDLGSAKVLVSKFDKNERESAYAIDANNVFELRLVGAKKDTLGFPEDGRIKLFECYRRGENMLPIVGPTGLVFQALQQHTDLASILDDLRRRIAGLGLSPREQETVLHKCMQSLEALVAEEWVRARRDPSRPMLKRQVPANMIRSSKAGEDALKSAQATSR